MKSFIVRIWTPSEPLAEGDERLRGFVERIGGGRSMPFGSEQELVAFLRDTTVSPGEAARGSAGAGERRS